MTDKPVNILIIETDEEDAFLLKEMLTGITGGVYYQTHYDNFIDGLEQIAIKKPDAVLIGMKEVNREYGDIDIFDEIRKIAPQTPIIVLYESQNRNMLTDIFDLGVQDYIQKSKLNGDILHRIIHHAIERKRVEAEIVRQTKEIEKIKMHYQAVLRSMPQGLCFLTHDWTILWANHAMNQIMDPMGVSTHAGEPVPFSVFFKDAKTFEDFKKDITKVLHKSPEACIRQIELKKGTREIFWAETSIAQTDPAESAPGYVAVIRDISKEKKAEMERDSLQRLSQRLNSVLDLSTLGEVIASECRKLFHNDSFWFSLYDEKDNSLSGIRIEDKIHEKAPPQSLPLTPPRLLLDKRYPLYAEARPKLINRESQKKSAKLVSFGNEDMESKSLMFAPICWQGKVVAVISAQSYTADKYSESDLSLLQSFAEQCGNALVRVRDEESLRESRERFKLAQDFSNTGTWDLDLKQNKMTLSDTACRLLHMSPREFNGTPSEFYDRIHPDDREFIRDKISECIRNGGIYEIEHRIIDVEGQIRWIYEKGNTIRDASGKATRMLGILADVSRRKRLDEERRHLVEELHSSERMAIIGQMVMGITHSMKNIFTPLKGGIKLISQALDNKDENMARKALEILDRASFRLYLLLLNMLDCSKPRKPYYETTNLKEIINEAVMLLKTVINEKPIEIETNVEEITDFENDSQKIFRCILNLGGNAIDAMPKGGKLFFRVYKLPHFECNEKTTVICGGREIFQNRDLIVIEVEDTGTGIPESKRENIFDLFYSTKSSYGTGLGLASTKQFVEEQGGTLLLESEEGVGTTFRILFPNY